MKAEEYSIIGIVIVFFGIGWIAYAWSQPYPVPPNCITAGGNPPNEVCGALTPVAQVFYVLGGSATILGLLMLFLRWYRFQPPIDKTIRTTSELPGGPTQANFLKKCPNCGRELPIAAEKCYTCGAEV